MASNVSVIFGQGRKQLVKTTPAMPLKNIVLAVCEKQQYPDVDSYGLKYGKTNLDLSLSVRFANLPAGAKLELVRIKATKIPTEVNVALQMEEGRLIQKFPTSVSFWDVLLSFEASSNRNLTKKTVKPATGFSFGKSNKAEVYLQPVCVYLNQEFGTISALKNTTLQSTGITSGNVLIRLIYRQTEKSLQDIEKECSSPILATNSTPTEVPADKTVQTSSQPVMQTSGPIQSQTIEPTQQLEPQPPVQAQTKVPPKEETQPLPQSKRQFSNSLETALPSQSSATPQTSSIVEEKAQTQPQEFTREVKVFRPSSDENMAAKIELPDSFYELTPAELKSIMNDQRTKRSLTDNAPLKTRQMREQEDLQRQRRYPRTLIRIRFPNRVQLQANFLSRQPISELISFVRESLKESEREFYLYVTPPIRKLTDHSQTFYDAGLTPASVVFFSFVQSTSESEVYLNDELMSLMEDLPSIQPEVISDPMDISDPKPPRNPSPIPREIHVPADYEPEHEKKDNTKKTKLPKWLKLGNK
ncbi:hypothetical protein K7432_003122 [Basidiobolus ranarum]|uniref:UBX domain-containing protein n=1 Tax=Basidiobolus ranarum TaxID=34480 RepID=A0ABR2W6M5_9FUNG